MDKNTKILLGIVAVVIVLGGLIWVVFSNNSAGLDSSNSTSSDYLKSIQPIPTSTATNPGNTNVAVGVYGSVPRVGDAEKNIPLYVDMIKKFEGNRFEFSNDCTLVSINAIVIKTGVKFMIDNRDKKPHVFSFAGQKYSVPDYGYAIVATPKIGIQPIYCDGVQRATVNVQK